MSVRHQKFLPLVPLVQTGSNIVLLAQCQQRTAARLVERCETHQRGGPCTRLMRVGKAPPEMDRLRLSIGLRLYGFDGAVLLLDPLFRKQRRGDAMAQLEALASHCRREGAMLVVVTARTERAAKALAGRTLSRARLARTLPQAFLGRRRKTTSKPTISIPSGGAG